MEFILSALILAAGLSLMFRAGPNPNATPGLGTVKTATPRRVMLAGSGVFLPAKIVRGAVSRDPLNTANLDVLRAGMVLGKITANSKYAPSIIGVLPSAHDSSGTTLTELSVGAANAVEIVRRIGSSGTFGLTGPPSAAGTVATTAVTFSAVNVTTGIVTITDIAVDKVAGSFIQPDDGSETPLVVLGDGYGLKVTDTDASNIDVEATQLLIGGLIDASQIINYPSDTSLITWLKSALNNVDGGGARFTFDDAY